MLYNFTNLTDQDIDVLGRALAELPHKTMWGLNQKLQMQINEQVAAEKAKNKAAEEAKAKKTKIKAEPQLEIVKD